MEYLSERKKLGHIDYIHNSVHGKTGGKRIMSVGIYIYIEIIMLTTTYQMRLCGLQGSSKHKSAQPMFCSCLDLFDTQISAEVHSS